MTTSSTLSLTTELAQFASAVELSTIPSTALEHSAQLVASTLEQARRTPAPTALSLVFAALGSPPDCTVFASNEKLGATYAAFINGTSARPTTGEGFTAAVGAAAVVPACIAAAEVARRAGPELLFGVAVGMEIALRLAIGLGESHQRRGFDLLGSAGRIGAAVGASRTLGHDEHQTVAAIGFAATQAGGPLRAAGAVVGGLLGGKAAADGLEAALLSGAELIGPLAPIEGRRGLFALEFAEHSAPSVREDLGSRWLLEDAPTLLGEETVLLAAARALLEDGSVYGLLDALSGA